MNPRSPEHCSICFQPAPRVLVSPRTQRAGMLMLLCRPDAAAHRFMPAFASGRFGELGSKPTIILLSTDQL